MAEFLLQGGAGFVGSHLVDVFVSQGYLAGKADNSFMQNHFVKSDQTRHYLRSLERAI
jgi:nucleoside-diphosphate-sugar epimerase